MTTHLSARLVWHDRGRDGHICDNPSQNAFCVVQQRIRESLSNPKNLEREEDNTGVPLAELDGWHPPCSRDPIALSAIGYTITHNDPADFTVSCEGDNFYWEHLGVLSVPSYKEKWDRKYEWYQTKGYLDQLITSEDRPDGSISSPEIESLARKHILLEDNE